MGDSPEVPIPQEDSETLNPEWKESIREGIVTSLDNAFIAFEETDESPTAPLDFHPLLITEGLDERTFDELDEQEKAFIQSEIFAALEFQDSVENQILEYEFSSPGGGEWEGKAKVSIYKTSRSEEGLFIHKVAYEDGKEVFVVAPEEYRL